jgi:hypothetical protein
MDGEGVAEGWWEEVEEEEDLGVFCVLVVARSLLVSSEITGSTSGMVSLASDKIGFPSTGRLQIQFETK